MLKRNWEPKLSMKHKYVHIIHDRMYKERNAECKYSKIKNSISCAVCSSFVITSVVIPYHLRRSCCQCVILHSLCNHKEWVKVINVLLSVNK
jgi:hypothetical protein